jgi:hypothetical protein
MEISKELAEQVLKMLKETETAVGQAADFAKMQIPDVINQLVHWKIATSIAGMAISLFFFCIIFYVWKSLIPKLYKSEAKERDKSKCYFDNTAYQFGTFALWTIGVGSLIGGTIGFCVNLYSLLQLVFAPKIYLIEYLTQLVHGSPK